MISIELSQVSEKLNSLMNEVLHGEEIIITEEKKEVARLIPKQSISTKKNTEYGYADYHSEVLSAVINLPDNYDVWP